MSEVPQEVFLTVDFNKASEFRGRSVEAGLPVTLPLCTLEDLLAWIPDNCDDAGQIFSISNVPYYGKDIPEGSTKTLVCHDMAGGYLDDRFVQGTVCKDNKWYYLAYWDVIDTFVYFSHHFITIPPVGWINCAHKNGVAVLGTFITESSDGYKRCKAIFSCELMWKATADRLVEIAKCYKFEGWLLNIENEIKKSHIEALTSFVKYLTTKMHETISQSKVIWYDSVTKSGTLDWQNELNSQNSIFFESCDGIFLNYGWSKKTLRDSVHMAETFSRVQDVYVGLDVFGRGCYGGGGMNSAAALEVIHRHKLSAAIFAPGWIKEVLGSKNFEQNQKCFWNSLSPYCVSHTVLLGEESFLATNFCTAMTQASCEIEERVLQLNQQQAMPSLSMKSFQSLPLVMTCRGANVRIESNSVAVLLRTKLSVTRGSMVVYLQGAVEEVVLVTSLGECKLFTARKFSDSKPLVKAKPPPTFETCVVGDWSNFYAWIVDCSSPFIVSEVFCKSGSEAFVSALAIYAIPENTEAMREMAMRYFKKGFTVSQTVIEILVKNVTWAKSTKANDMILLSCTLDFGNIDESKIVNILYRTVQSNFKPLGTASCRQYRIDRLAVPDPVYYGQRAKLQILAEQNCLPNPNLTDRSGLLEIKYARI